MSTNTAGNVAAFLTTTLGIVPMPAEKFSFLGGIGNIGVIVIIAIFTGWMTENITKRFKAFVIKLRF